MSVKPEHFDLELGDGHWLAWSTYDGERCGAIIYHLDPKSETGFCSAAFTIAGTKICAVMLDRPVWKFSGTWDIPTLAPSFVCHCGDHGFVRNGLWVRA
jgi:Family of unknown function (DUF6527)